MSISMSQPKKPSVFSLQSVTGSVLSQTSGIHAPFFKGSILVALTLGAFWGAWILVGIGLEKSFTAVDINQINAHGHAQIFGWVGLFVMGFVYAALPRFTNARIVTSGSARATMTLMLAGIIIRTGAQTFLTSATGIASFVAIGSGLEIAAVSLFASSVWQQVRRLNQQTSVFEWFILCGSGWFVVQAVLSAVYCAAFVAAVDRDALVWLVSNWQAPLRDIQIHGFALLMILGIAEGVLRVFYDVETGSRRRNLVALAAINLALVGEVAGFVLMRNFGHAWAALWYGATILMAIALMVLVSGWKVWAPLEKADPALKFFRAAFVWLFISVGMSLLLPVYQFVLVPRWAPDSEAAAMGFSHAYYGAVRHAITVGFASLVIMGSVARATVAWGNVPPTKLPGFGLAFLLINAGCATRVFFQASSDSFEIAFPIMGISGFLEFSALALWAVVVWRLMDAPPPQLANENRRIFRQRIAFEEQKSASMRRALQVHPRRVQ